MKHNPTPTIPLPIRPQSSARFPQTIGGIALGALLLITTAIAAEPEPGKTPDGWVDLFNGKDLKGWSARTGKEGDESSQKADEIFTVKDGVIHVYQGAAVGSRQLNANLLHESVWQNFHLRVEYRWLEKKFVPRTKDDRDAGILFHVHTAPETVWPPSLEMQLGDGKPGSAYVAGDLFVLGSTRTDSTVKGTKYDPAASPVTCGEGAPGGRRGAVTLNADHPVGEWNTADVIVHGSKSAEFYVNGTLLNKITNMKFKDKDGEWKPLEKGQVSIQAEWAELEYRAVRIKELKE
jgi:hypothetical protein